MNFSIIKMTDDIFNDNVNIEIIEKQIKPSNFVFPTIYNFEKIILIKYSLVQLKNISKFYKLKIGFNKQILIDNLILFLKKNKSIVILQKIIRGYLLRKLIKLHGSALYKRELCVNDTDFLSMDDLKSIKYSQFYCFTELTKDKEYIYGFDILSLFNLIGKHNDCSKIVNPYTRNFISKQNIENLYALIKLSKALNIKIRTIIKNTENEITNEKSIELRILDLFQAINSLGNYSDHLWFYSLNKQQLLRFLYELQDVWNYRSQLTLQTQREICPDGYPFRSLNAIRMISDYNLTFIQRIIIDIMEEMVHTGINTDSKSLGAYYILGCLTLVNYNASNALPWLYDSFYVN